MTALNPREAFDLSTSAAVAQALFTPSETTAEELAVAISETWLFATSIAGPLCLEVVVRWTRPASHFSTGFGGRTQHVLGRYRDAAFPDFDEELVFEGVRRGVLTAAAPDAAPRVGSESQIWSTVQRCQWSIAGSREQPAARANLVRPASAPDQRPRSMARVMPGFPRQVARSLPARPLAFA